jgi:hypothetical protein
VGAEQHVPVEFAMSVGRKDSDPVLTSAMRQAAEEKRKKWRRWLNAALFTLAVLGMLIVALTRLSFRDPAPSAPGSAPSREQPRSTGVSPPKFTVTERGLVWNVWADSR